MSDENETTPETPAPAEPEASAPAAETTPYLTRAKMLLVEDVVYCLEHTAVHDDTTDPHGYGQPDCSAKEHRPVYYRARKGDVDEMHDESQHGESRAAGALPDGAVVVDSLSAVQEQVKTRIISQATPPVDGLTDPERTLVLRLVMRESARAAAALDELHQIVGIVDLSNADHTLATLGSVCTKLGGETMLP